jgi:hypothetical protein
MTVEGTHLKLALHRVWDEIAHRTFLHAAKTTLTAEEVRAAVARRLAELPSADEAGRRYWGPLTDPQRLAALAMAFPHGPYTARPDGDVEDFRPDPLTD